MLWVPGKRIRFLTGRKYRIGTSVDVFFYRDRFSRGTSAWGALAVARRLQSIIVLRSRVCYDTTTLYRVMIFAIVL